MTWHLLPGLPVGRRDAHHLQVGLDQPRAAVLPDVPGVRRLLLDLAAGAPLPTLDPLSARALSVLVEAELVVTTEDEAARRTARSRYAVHLDVPADLLAPALDLVAGCGLATTRRGQASVAVVWSVGEPDRERLDAWMRSGTAHLVVAELTDGVRLGPYVSPGSTACLRCVDAHVGESDPVRGMVLAQAVSGRPLREHEPDPAARSLALGWAVRDLVAAAHGDRPTTWSATVVVVDGLPEVTPYRRHLHCGCAWAEPLAETG